MDDGGSSAAGKKKLQCEFCSKVVTNEIHIACAVCPDLRLCLECFSVGAEPGNHINSHDYRVADNMKFPIYEVGWGADEELLLLEAIEIYGMGNWRDIASKVPFKSPEECERHYIDTYIKSKRAPLPVPLQAEDISSAKMKQDSQADGEATGRISPSLSSGPPSPTGPLTMGDEFANHHPKRGDFETEFENDAELAVKEMVFYEDDAPLDRELKHAMLDIYNDRLRKRVARKHFAHEYGLTDQALVNNTSVGEPKRVADELRCFSRFHTPENHVAILRSAAEEAKLKDRIAFLQEARRMGVTKRKDLQVYQQEKRKRDARLARLHSMSASGAASAGSSVQGRRALTKSNGFNVEKMASAQLLSAEELQLCSQNQLLPTQYMAAKMGLVRDKLSQSKPTPSDAARYLNTSDMAVAAKVLDFLRAMAWV